MEQKGVSPVVGTILLIAITVALAAIVAMLVSGLGGRGAPPSAMLTVTAVDNVGLDDHYKITISHEGGDDLVRGDLQVQASDTSSTLHTYDNAFTGSGAFSVGGTVTFDCIYPGIPAGTPITVYIIHKPSKQKMFNSSTVVVAA